MKALVAAAAVTAVTLVATTAPARAETAFSVQVATPQFGISIGTPVPLLPPAAVYVPPVPVYATAPVYVPPPPVVYLPPRVLIPAPVVSPVVYAYGYRPAKWHRKHGRAETRRASVPGASYYYVQR